MVFSPAHVTRRAIASPEPSALGAAAGVSHGTGQVLCPFDRPPALFPTGDIPCRSFP